MFAVAIQAATAVEAVEQIAQAEAAGVDGAWATMGGAGGVDMIPVFAAAAMRTARIRLGTAIVHTWPRHPIVLAQEAMAIEQLAPVDSASGLGRPAPCWRIACTASSTAGRSPSSGSTSSACARSSTRAAWTSKASW